MLIGGGINRGRKFSMEARCRKKNQTWKLINQASNNRVESIIGYEQEKNEF